MAAVTICSDFEAPKNKVWPCFHCFPIYFPWSDGWDQMPWSSFSECWALSQLFHSPLSLSSRGFWVPLHFLHIWGYWDFSRQSWFQLVFLPVQRFSWCTLLLLLLLSRFSRVRLCGTPQTAAHQAPPSLGFSRQDHWSGLPFPSPMHESKKWKWSHSVVSDPQQPHGLQPTRLLCPWDFPGSTGVGCHLVISISVSISTFLTLYILKHTLV